MKTTVKFVYGQTVLFVYRSSMVYLKYGVSRPGYLFWCRFREMGIKKVFSFYLKYGKARPYYLNLVVLRFRVREFFLKRVRDLLNFRRPYCRECWHTVGYWTRCKPWHVSGYGPRLWKKGCYMKGFKEK